MKAGILIFAIISLLSSQAQAQLKVYSSGNVGIGATNPVSFFSVGGDGYLDSKSTFHNTSRENNQKALRVIQAMPQGQYIYGLVSTIETGTTSGVLFGLLGSAYRGATATNSGQSIGVRGQAGNARNGWNFPIWAELLGTANGAAIIATVPGKGGLNVGGMYAGYFRGNVKIENDLNVAGLFINSDISMKEDIRSLDANNVSKIMQLKAIKYKMKSPYEWDPSYKASIDTANQTIKAIELSDPVYQRDNIGISAQEIQKIYPEIVKVEENGFLSVNYIALIPILMEAIKEQQMTIEDLKQKVAKLSSKR